MIPEQHWQHVYSAASPQSLSWYEAEPQASLRLIERCRLAADDPILDAGAGASTLIDRLLDLGYTNLTALDISPTALEILRARLGPERSAHVAFIAADIARPDQTAGLPTVALWHDRALLHFLTAEPDRQAYCAALRRAVRPGGFAVIAAFSPDGARQCSGLPVCNYDATALVDLLAPDFSLEEALDHLHTTPSGAPRPYVYALFVRQ